MTTAEKRQALKDLLAGKITVYDLPGNSIVKHWYGYQGTEVWYDADGNGRHESQIIVGRHIFNIFHISTGFQLANREEDIDLSVYTGPRVPSTFNINDFICAG